MTKEDFIFRWGRSNDSLLIADLRTVIAALRHRETCGECHYAGMDTCADGGKELAVKVAAIAAKLEGR